MGLLDPRFSNTIFSKSWILDPDPRFLPWIQEKFFENLGSWILDPYNVRLAIFKSELFSDLRFKSQKLE